MNMNVQDMQLLRQEIKDLMIPADDVAHVLLDNSLEHALLVLIRSGYSAVPVLDLHFRIHGLISKTLILDSILGTERIEYEKLNDRTVQEAMNTSVPRLKEHESFFRALELSINNPFICIEDDEGMFLGLLTRRSILALVYRYFRNL